MILALLLTILIVGFVTAGLNIRFDRFFTILLLLFLFKFTIFRAINVFLWVIFFGSLMVLFNNQDKISKLPKKMKIKFFVFIPLVTLVFSLLGSWIFFISPESFLIIVLGVLAILYGLRLVLIHFKEHELNFEKGHPKITKICGTFGPAVSGFFIGLLGTSLKPLKMPFAIKLGKMNSKQVYLGNTLTAFFASLFSLIWHSTINTSSLYKNFLLGAALWVGIHYTFEFTNIFFKKKWRKSFQILIGIILILISIKIFALLP